ncbi:MAG: hypothetical protein AAF945_12910, partial [Actinomycetota bacterium]
MTVGKDVAGSIVHPIGVTPLYPESAVGMSKWIVSTSALAFASSIAARSVHSSSPAAFVPPVQQYPSPGEASPPSPVELT